MEPVGSHGAKTLKPKALNLNTKLVANGTNIKGKAEDTEEATLGSSQDSTYRPGPSKGEA